MKKINIGIVLIILSIISFVIVVILDVKNQKDEIEKAREFASEFLEVMEKYTLLPEEYRDINKVMRKEEYEKYILEMREEVGKYLLDDMKDYLLDLYEKILCEQYKGSYILSKCSTEIEYIDVISYVGSRKKIGDILKIYFNEKVKSTNDKRIVNIKDDVTDRFIGEITHIEKEGSVPNSMLLKKLNDGEYKVVWYAKQIRIL